ncbi:MAG TPA: YceI family protein [bacterium]|nr:YceI family protein [bacterium]
MGSIQMRYSWKYLFYVLAMLSHADSVSAQAVVLHRWRPEENIVVFESNAPAELLIARTRAVNGILKMPSQLITAASGEVVVETGAFRSGISVRDETIRSPEWLNAEYHPLARLTINRLISDENVFGVSREVEAVAEGVIEIRGATHEIRVAATLCYRPPHHSGDPDARLRIDSEFEIDMRDFGMVIPPYWIARISPTLVVSTHLLARGSIVSPDSPLWSQQIPSPPVPSATVESEVESTTVESATVESATVESATSDITIDSPDSESL